MLAEKDPKSVYKFPTIELNSLGDAMRILEEFVMRAKPVEKENNNPSIATTSQYGPIKDIEIV